MHVAEFFGAFMFGPYVEIIEPFLPDVLRDVVEEGSLGRISSSPRLRQNASRKSNFESLHHGRRSLDLRLADEKVNMFGHDHVTGDDELVAPAHLLEHGEKQIAAARGGKQELPPITTAGDEMKVPGAVVAL